MNIHGEVRNIFMVRLPRQPNMPQLWYNNKGYGRNSGQTGACVRENDFQHAQVFHSHGAATSAARGCGGTVETFSIIAYTDVP